MMRRTAALLLALAALGCGGGDDEESASEPAATSQADTAATVAPRRADEICAGLAERVGQFNELDRPGPDDVKTFSRELGKLSNDAADELAATPGDPQVDSFRRALEAQTKALADVEKSVGESGRAIDEAVPKLDRAFQRVRETATELGASC